MAKERNKTVHYYRARHDGELFDLQKMLVATRKTHATCDLTEKLTVSDEVIRIQHYSASAHMVKLHIVRYVPGERAATLLPKANTAEDDESVHAPPKGKEYKDGDCFLLVSEGDVLFCSHGISSARAVIYLQELFNEGRSKTEKIEFHLTPAANLDKLQLIEAHGVKSMQLNLSAFAASLDQNKRTSLIGRVSESVVALLKKDDSVKALADMQDLVVNVGIRLKGNTQAVKGSQLLLKQLGIESLDDEGLEHDNFVIVTQKDEPIHPEEIYLRSQIKVHGQDNSVDHISAWQGMSEYFDTLKGAHLLEQ